MRKYRCSTFALGALFLLPGCFLIYPRTAPAPGPITSAQMSAAREKWPEASEQSLAAGRQIFVERCNECHDHPDIMSIDEGEWPEIVEEMAGKADLTAEQKTGVLRF